MPEEITIAPAPARRSVARAVGIGCAVLVAVPLLLVIAFLVWLAVVTKDASDFPRVAPEEMAARAVDRSREAYDVLGFTRTIPPGVEELGVSTENTLSSGYCYRGGMTDETVDGAYRMSHEWALDDVPAEQAVPALRRLHDHLKKTGWEISSYRENVSGDYWSLFASRSDGEERVSFQWYADRDYFSGDASTSCAVDPGWKKGDLGLAGENLTPDDFGPSGKGVAGDD
ncbi:hypothetical protein [Streptomyces sp. A012304]|uniref:hypothetical protein n=1 Tax=Streptomyces sp. A012304 TaxID=375446 RepID=UPI00222E1153|nr:hypothetical protein [Streptomyces sp. A012304]GKQ36688.1 hypothetical protein ALMP_32280 [Streptomyces sp. A012304]